MYIIINTKDSPKIVWGPRGGIKERSLSSARKSPDGQYVMIEYDGDQPKWVFGITKDKIGLKEYSSGEIIDYIDEHWSNGRKNTQNR